MIAALRQLAFLNAVAMAAPSAAQSPNALLAAIAAGGDPAAAKP